MYYVLCHVITLVKIWYNDIYDHDDKMDGIKNQ